MRLKYQLFLTLLVVSALMISLMFAINTWSFQRGFLGYVNTVETQRLKPLITVLGERYKNTGNWDWIKNNRREFRNLLDTHLLGGQRSPDRNRPPPPDRRPPPPGGDVTSELIPPRPPSRGSLGDGKPITMDPRLLFADSEKTLLVGRTRHIERVQWQPITVDDAIVGYVGYVPRTQVTAQLDRVFEQQQKKGFGYTALAMILLSALLAIPLAAYVVKPLLRVSKAVDQISQGFYDHRVTMTRHDEIGDLARNINHLGATLEENLDARQRWIAEISHELRTPVAILRGELESYLDGVRMLNPDSVASLHAEVLRLNRLIDDLHDLSLSDLGGLNYQMQSVDLAALVRSHLEADAATLESAGLTLELNSNLALAMTIPAMIMGDQQRLDQMIGNLLQNSVHYTDRGGVISVKVDVTDDQVILNWQDSAPGVPTDQLSSLFDPLFRTEDSRNRNSGGSGLGLCIVKKIVEAHQGIIVANPSSLGGIHISISVPLATGAVH